MISSSSDPCLSGRWLRELNETERDETEEMRASLSIKVKNLDPYSESDQSIDIRTQPERG